MSVHLLSIFTSIPCTKIYLHSIHLYTTNLHTIDLHSTYHQTTMSTHTISIPPISMPSTSTPFARHQHTSYLLQCVSTPNSTCLAPASDSNSHQTDGYNCPALHSTRVSVFPNVWDSHQTSRHDRGDLKSLPTTEPTNIRCHCTKFSRP